MKKQILVVDDFENTRWVIKHNLTKLDCEILEAANGMEALKLFDGRQIDLLITDLNMPKLNGIELVKEVRSKKKYEFIPIIMLTTERSMDKIKEAENVKVTTWVNKPFEQEKFLKIVAKCINQSIR
ncbi:MAG: response regulator [Bacteroidales bacterium]|nr:response regulator [Bacteroidales bacterium]